MRGKWMIGALVTLLALLLAAPATRAQDADDGLERVRSKRFAEAYLRPGAEFRPYSRVLLEPVTVAFKPGWMEEMGTATGSWARRRVTPEDAARIQAWLAADFAEALARALTRAGFELATEPGPDVLRITPALTNVYLSAPESWSDVAPTRSYTRQAGEATVVLEARDSELGVLLGRAIDRRRTTYHERPQLANESINRSEFGSLFSRWSKRAADGLEGLQAASAVTPAQRR